jgi:hypothetical protein
MQNKAKAADAYISLTSDNLFVLLQSHNPVGISVGEKSPLIIALATVR